MTERLTTWTSQAKTLWMQRSPRERWLLMTASLALALALLWTVGLAPALRTWQEAPAKQAQLDTQTQHMRQLQAQAEALKQTPALSRRDAIQWLESHLSELGPKAQLTVQAEHLRLNLQAAPAQALAQWLAQAREQAHARPIQAQLQQSTLPDTANKAADKPILWSGSVLLRLP